MNNDSIKSNYISVIAAIILVTSRIIHPYGWQDKISFDELAFIFLIIITLFTKGFKNYLPKWLILYYVYRFVNHCFHIQYLSNIIYPTLWISLLTFLVLYEDIELKSFFKIYKITAIVCITFFFLQEITFQATGYRISGISSYLPIYLSGVENSQTFVSALTMLNRSASFFSEPAAFVQFLLPLLCIFVFNEKIKNRILWIFFIFISLILAKSGNGMLGLLIIAVVFFFKTILTTSWKIRIISVTGFIIIGLLGSYYYINSELGMEMMSRQDEVMEINEKTSGFFRIFRGFLIFDHYSFTQKLFGLDNMYLIEKMTFKSGYGLNTHLNLYFNVVQHILLRTGYIGLFLFFMFIRSLWKNNNWTGRTIILVFVGFMFLTSHYFSSTMYFYLTLAYKFQQFNIQDTHKKNNYIETKVSNFILNT